VFYTVYKTTNLVNGKIYIGKHQTKDLNDGYMGSGKHLWNSIRKYGIDNFRKEILFTFDNEAEMNSKESELVTEEFVKEDTNYNLCPGGKGGWGYINTNGLSPMNDGSKRHKERCIKAGRASSKKQEYLIKNDPEWVEMKRIKYSENAKKQIENNNGKHWSKGYKHTEEWKENHSIIMKEKQSGNKNSQFGSMWITNGTESRKINKNDTIPEGWCKGRKIK